MGKTQAEIEAASRREDRLFAAILIAWFVLFFGSFVVMCLGAIYENDALLTIGVWIFLPTTILAVIAVFGVACFVAESRS